MVERYMFFDSVLGDERPYQQKDFADYWSSFLSNGIIHRDGVPKLEVTANSTNRDIRIDYGRAIIHGHLYLNLEEDGELIHRVDDPDSMLDRIDRVVIRYDNSIKNRYIKSFIVKGIESENPEPPELTREGDVYELSLAQIRVVAGKSFIEQTDITDERLNEDVCGLASSLVTLPLDVFNDELQRMADEWNEWFSKQQTEGYVLQSEKGQPGGVVATEEKGEPGGVASLDNEGNVPIDQLLNALILYDENTFRMTRKGTAAEGTYTLIDSMTVSNPLRVKEIRNLKYIVSAPSSSSGWLRVSYQIGNGSEIFLPERRVLSSSEPVEYNQSLNILTHEDVTFRTYGYRTNGTSSVYCEIPYTLYSTYLYTKGAY